MLKKFLSCFKGFKAKVNVSLEVSLEVPVKPSPPPLEKMPLPKTEEAKTSSDNLLRLPVVPVKSEQLSYDDECFILNVAKYQLAFIRKAALKSAEESLIIYLPEQQLAITYRADIQKWEVFFNGNRWGHKDLFTSYEIPREKLEYLTPGMGMTRMTYIGGRNIEHVLSLVEQDFFLHSGEEKELKQTQFHWQMWKELATA